MSTKKLMTLILIILLPAIVAGQAYLVDVDNIAFGEVKTEYVDGQFTNDVEWGEFERTNLTIAVDLDNLIIKVNNEQRTVLMLEKESVEINEKLDEDGDKMTIALFNAIDEENIECVVKMRTWNDYNIFQLYIIYSDMYICFDGSFKPDEDQKVL